MTRKRKPVLFFGFALILIGCATNVLSAVDSNGAGGTTLGVADGRFTINGRPTFLLGFSYFAGVDARETFVQQDLDAFQRRHFNWLRIFATWNAFGTNMSVVDSAGERRQPFFDHLKRLLKTCDRQDLIVDITLARSKDVLPNFNSHKAAVSNLVSELRLERNWYLDLANEHDVRDSRYVPDAELKQLRAEARRLDPKRLVTASFGGHDLATDEIRAAVQDIGLDFICIHRPRDAGSPAQTFQQTTNYLALLKQIGKSVPLHYQEPFRRDYSDWQPKAEDFLADLRGAMDGGASGWCFHTGSPGASAQSGPRRCFDLRYQSLFDQLDAEERKAVDEVSNLVVQVTKAASSR